MMQSRHHSWFFGIALLVTIRCLSGAHAACNQRFPHLTDVA